MRKIITRLPLAATLALGMFLPACDSSNTPAPTPTPGPAAPTPTPSPSPSPSPTPTPTARDVTACLTQEVGGTSVANLIIPDTITIDFAQPAGFPNGRRLADPVIDVTLAVIFLDLDVHSPTTLANVPVNPAANDRPFLTGFPFAAPPQGNPPLASGTGSNFNFRTDPAAAYVRVDRTGMPAVATALVVGNDDRDAYNDDDPADDVTAVWVPEFVSTLEALHVALADDLEALSLTVCSTPK